MRRLVRSILLSLALIVVAAPDATAKSWWGWLEEFSGPGPFEGPLFGASLGQMLCADNSGGISVLSAGTSGTSRTWDRCIWVDGRFLHAPPRDAFRAADVFMVDGGFSMSYRGLASLGAGAGVLQLVVDAEDDDATVRRLILGPRVTVSFARVVDEAVDKFILRRTASSPKWLGFVKLYYKPTFVAGAVTAADIGMPPSTWEGGGNEWLDSWGISFDFLEFTSR